MTGVELRQLTRKELAQQARRGRISGWHGMKKEELVRALLNRQRNERRRTRQQTGRANDKGNLTAGSGRAAGRSKQNPNSSNGNSRDLSGGLGKRARSDSDSVHAEAGDPYWIHVSWTFSPATIRRAEAALGIDWHRAVPVIRLFDVTAGEVDGPDCRRQLSDIEIHGDVDHWYVPVERPERTYKLHIGYLSPTGRFHAVGKSRVVHMPRPGTNGAIDRTWQRDTKPAKANGRKPNGKSRTNGHATNGHAANDHDFSFRVDAELIVHGETHPQAELTLLGEPVELTQDGRFSLRFALPNGRQVIPAITVTPSGAEQHTIVLAVERNTKELAPQRTDELA